MTAIIFASRLDTSPYAYLLDPSSWFQLGEQLAKDFCVLIGLPSESPLMISVTIGASALPTIMKMGEIMKIKKVDWGQQEEKPP